MFTIARKAMFFLKYVKRSVAASRGKEKRAPCDYAGYPRLAFQKKPTNSATIGVASRPALAVLPGVSSLLALAPQAAGAAVRALRVAPPQVEEIRVAVANARSA